jgi:hypothetical protein
MVWGLLCPASAHAQLQVNPIAGLRFGSLVGVPGGTVTVAPSGARTVTNGALAIEAGSHHGAATFSVRNEHPTQATPYCLSLSWDPNSFVDARLAIGAPTLSHTTGILAPHQSVLVTVGATLTVRSAGPVVGNHQAAGAITLIASASCP